MSVKLLTLGQQYDDSSFTSFQMPFGVGLILPANLIRGSAASGYFQTTISNLDGNQHLDLALPLGACYRG